MNKVGLRSVLLGGLIAILLIAPLPFGSVERGASGLLTAVVLGLGAFWVAWRSRRGLAALPWRHPVLIWGALFAAFGLAQTLPMPGPLLESISPQTSSLHAEFKPPEIDGASGRLLTHGAADGWRPISLNPWAGRQSALRFLACVVAALIARDLAARRSGSRWLAASLVAGGGLQAVYGLAEYLSGHQHILGYAKEYYTDVATGTFINRNHFAGYLEMVMPLAIAFAVMRWARTKRPRAPGGAGPMPGREMFMVTALLLLALVMATALVSSRSRMGIVSLVLAMTGTSVLLLRQGRGGAFAVTLAVVTATTLALFSQGAGAPIVERFRTAAGELEVGIGRWSIWAQAAGMASSFPAFGVGLGAFGSVFPSYRTTGAGAALAHAHSDFVELAAETGAVGTLIFLLGAFFCLLSLARRTKGRSDFGHLGHAASAGALALTFHSLTDFNLSIPANALTFSVLVGLVFAWRNRSAEDGALPDASSSPGAGRGLGSAALVAAIFLIAAVPGVAGAIGLSSTGEGGAASLLDRLDRDDAERFFVEAEGAGAPPLADLRVLVDATAAGTEPSGASLEYVRKRLARAISLQAAGLRLVPASSSGHLTMGRLLAGFCFTAAMEGEPHAICVAAAAGEFRAALRLNPMSAAVHAQVARFYVKAWPAFADPLRREAGAVIERAVALNPVDEQLKSEWTAVKEVKSTGS